MVPPVECVELWYDAILLGRVSRVVDEDGVVSGVIAFVPTETAQSEARDLLAYVNFSIDWNERARTQHRPPSTSEFDEFDPILKSGKWFAKAGAERTRIDGAPVFFKGNEVSWRCGPRLAS